MLTFNLSFLLNSLYIKRNLKVFYIHINSCDNIWNCKETYWRKYILKYNTKPGSTSDCSRWCCLNIQTQVCGFRKQTREKYKDVSLFPLLPQDRMVQFGKTKIFPKFQIGATAHPRVIAGFPVKVKEFAEGSWQDCHSLCLLFTPFLPRPPSPAYHWHLHPCPCGPVLDQRGSRKPGNRFAASDFDFSNLEAVRNGCFWEKWVRVESVVQKTGLGWQLPPGVWPRKSYKSITLFKSSDQLTVKRKGIGRNWNHSLEWTALVHYSMHR